jgi:xanthine/CO dehydrogenase XdhC/CoxF family maturation factor
MTMSRTDKETRLKDFIAESLQALAEGPNSGGTVTMMVRSVDSPTARALHAALAESPCAALDIRVIVADTRVEDAALPSLRDMAGIEFRHLSDSRFGASHEQLVVGRTHVWIGDCLRRDPNKRDAFELYHKADPVARKCASVSFERLWARAKPTMAMKSADLAPEIIPAGSPTGFPWSHRQ